MPPDFSPDFSGQNLRGRNFKGQDLTGANFTNADIRGANFTNAILVGANFAGARAEAQKHWMVVQFLLSLVLSTLLNFTSILISAVFIASALTSESTQNYTIFPGIAILLVNLITFVAIARQGLTTKAAATIAIAVAVTVAVTVAGAVAGAVTVAGASAGAVAVAVAVAVAGASAGAGAVAGAVAGVGAGAGAAAVTNAGAGASAGAGAGAVLLLSLYVAWRVREEDEKFALARSMGVALGAIGGTSFRGADLTAANFTGAILSSAKFTSTKQQQTNLTHVCWKDAKKLNRARVGGSILSDRAVRELLVTRNGYKRTYVKADLRSANLDGINLNEANLQWADLSEATAQHADLRGANLRETLALGTDFSGACLTGACLEAWNIDHTTNLESIDCQYLYLLRDKKERRPSSGDFAPGEFTKLFQKALSTVDLIFRNGIDWKAFVIAFQQVQDENEDTELIIQSIENKGDGVVVVRVSVPPDADKPKIHSEFNQNYEPALKAVEARYQAALEVRDGEIAFHREQNTNLLKVIKSLANQNQTTNVFNEIRLMSNSNDQSRSLNVGGNVSNTINQLQNSDRPQASELADLLKQLQTAIESEPDLEADDKTEALEQLNTLAKAGQNPEDGTLKKLAGTALKIIKGTVSALPDTAKLAEACSKLLPLIVHLIGL